MVNAATDKILQGLNPEQTEVVRTINCDVLVNAGAGTGKTHTLTRRYAYLLLKKPATPDEPTPTPRTILAITYTDAAADKLRANIQDQLRVFAQGDTLSEDDSRLLASHVRAMDQAWISTIHAFCGRIIRAHALELDLDPNYGQLDALQATNLQAEVLDEFERGVRIPATNDMLKNLDISQFGGLTDKQVVKQISTVSDEDLYAALMLTGVTKNSLRKSIKCIRSLCTRHGKAMEMVESQSWDLAVDDAHRKEILEAKLTIELTRRFEQRYREEKAKRGVLDFDDLLLKAHELLTTNEKVRESYRERFDYIMVDEFQDTSPLTYEIVESISNNNLCLVGDGKQAIFGFTGADVSLISHLTEKWSKDPTRVVIPLSVNYRSTQPVLDFANTFCAHELMLGSDRMQALTLGRDPARKGVEDKITLPPVSVIGIGLDDKEKTETMRHAEATFIAQHFAKLIKMGVSPAEMTILVRTHAHGEVMLEVLEEHGLQGTIVGGKSFYKEVVVTELLDVLRLIRNPHDDQAFISVALSVVGNLSDQVLERLGALTNPSEKGGKAPAESLFEATHLFVQSSDGSVSDRSNASHFAEVVNRAIAMTGRYPIREVITAFYRDRGILDWWEQQGFRAERDKANFRKFLRIADALSQDDQSTIDLIQKIERAQEDEQDESIGQWLEEENNQRIQIMTLHTAKGQEFPVVAYFADIQEAKSEQGSFAYYNDGREDIEALFERTLAHPDQKNADEARRQWAHHEPGAIIYLAKSVDDKHKRAALRTMYRNAHFEREFDETIRLFYVAATRAEDYLLITYQATDKEPGHPYRKLGYTLTKVSKDEDADIPADLQHIAVGQIDYPAPISSDDDHTMLLFGQGRPKRFLVSNQLVQVSASQIRTFNQCPWRYWWTYANRLSVESDAAWERSDEEGDDHPPLSAAEKGTVLHKLLELLTNGGSSKNLGKREIDRILSEHGVQKEERPAIVSAVEAYRKHELFAEVLAHDIVHTEYQFYTPLDSYYLYGFMDVLAVDSEGDALIVDYKISDSDASDISETYGKQARLYAFGALEQGAQSVRVVFAQIKGSEVVVHKEKTDRVYTAWDIDELRAEILADIEAMQQVPTKQPARRKEGLCTYCPVPQALCSHREQMFRTQDTLI